MSNYFNYRPEWIREDFVDFIAEKIHPLWAWKRIKASVISVRALSDDFYQLQLRPNHNFQHQQVRAGQSILVTLPIDGVHQQRSYSIVELTATGDIVIAVRVQGQVSLALSQLTAGAVLEISQAQGDFVLQPNEQPLLLVASGSGITAIYSLLKEALATTQRPLHLIYFSRDEAFHVKLQLLAEQNSQFHYHHINTRQQKQHLNLQLLQQYVPDFEQAETYACGHHAMMQSIQQIYQERGITAQLKQEYFQVNIDDALGSQPVTFLRSQQQFDASGTLLVSAEEAGLRPAHGCRMGICNACSCTKVSGSTKNILTGEIDHDSNSQIRLCIHQAVSPVVINL